MWNATLTISCVDTVAARQETAEILKELAKRYHGRDRGQYWMDFGNSRSSGQVILSTIDKIRQPASELYRTVEELPLMTEEFKDLLSASEKEGNTPSCSFGRSADQTRPVHQLRTRQLRCVIIVATVP